MSKNGAVQRDEESGDAAARVPMSGRSRTPVMAAIAVFVVIMGMLAYASAGAFIPVRSVRVSPVIGTAVAVQVPPEEEQGDGGESGRFVRGGGERVQAPGWLEADPFYVACTALADGIVESVLVLEGERVEKGRGRRATRRGGRGDRAPSRGGGARIAARGTPEARPSARRRSGQVGQSRSRWSGR